MIKRNSDIDNSNRLMPHTHPTGCFGDINAFETQQEIANCPCQTPRNQPLRGQIPQSTIKSPCIEARSVGNTLWRNTKRWIFLPL